MITLTAANRITEERVSALRESFKLRVKVWIDACMKAGILPYVYCGVRTVAEQNRLFAMGRKVTRARGGQSFHNYGRAVDWVPLVPAKRAPGMYEAGWDEQKIYAKAAKIGEKYGLRAISWETGHFEDGYFANWQELAAKEKPI